MQFEDIKLDELLEQLSTPEARNKVIAWAVEEGLTNDPRHIEITNQHNEETIHDLRGDWVNSTIWALHKALFEKEVSEGKLSHDYAVELAKREIKSYERLGWFKDSARLAEWIGDERAKTYRTLADLIGDRYYSDPVNRNPNQPSWLVRQLEVEKIILQQYEECTKPLNELFRYAPDKCWSKDGVGCCGVGRDIAEDGIGGLAGISLIRMRDARLAEEQVRDSEGMEYHGACPYHKKDSGCILGELKSPRCLAHYCKADLPDSYSYGYVKETLEKIWGGDLDFQSGEFNPEKNWQLVKEFKAYVGTLIEEAKSKGG